MWFYLRNAACLLSFPARLGADSNLSAFLEPGILAPRVGVNQSEAFRGKNWTFDLTPMSGVLDSSQGTNAVYSYVTAGNSPIYVSGVVPVNGASGIGANSEITAFVVDGNPAKVASVQMWMARLRQ